MPRAGVAGRSRRSWREGLARGSDRGLPAAADAAGRQLTGRAAVVTRVVWSSPAERARIVDGALALLERVGMRFGRGDALAALAQAGARVDETAGALPAPPTCTRRR